MADDAKVHQLKELVIQKLNEGEFAGLGVPKTDNMRLIRQGIELKPNQAAISQFVMASGDVLHSQLPNPLSLLLQRRMIINQADEEPSREATKMRNMSIYQRNFEECVKASKRGINPSERPRYNDPSREPPRDPILRDLGDMVDDLGNALIQWSSQLQIAADVLLADRKYKDDGRLERERWLIDNNMQAARYLSPIVKQLSAFIFPINRGEDPRIFKVK
ncbi:Oidioi.mRNA.OKI2018_I69.PAR.g8664.t1.cds [Oikopleura dioica]|uniref:Oidioi.mRNA.OKI2018_I69.PAR.g8664.t1.cds n=1 Tax=Oikopleura dioica TaxID=34765 RepID=A0ABN7RH13_OIKDI|nr:Oidioi.mRNA.OKI2018_I69.PAR.g8664.t1.cds [Oikopleura dioica]